MRERKSDEHRRRPAPGSHNPRRRVGPVRRFWGAVAVAVGLLAGWGSGEDLGRWDAYAGIRDEPTVLGLTVIQVIHYGLDAGAQ